MNKASRILAFAILILNPLVSANAAVSCNDLSAPVAIVADFDANGVVNGKDIAVLAKNMGLYQRSHNRRSSHHRSNKNNSHRSRHQRSNREATYSALFDRNADGKINSIDMFLATRDMGKTSSTRDQELITAYNTDSCINVSDTAPTSSTVNSNGGIDLYEEPGLD